MGTAKAWIVVAVWTAWGIPAAIAQTGPDTWSEPPVTTVPANFGYGASLAGKGDDFLYALHGGGTTLFSRYQISKNVWVPMAPAPATISYGGALVYATQGGSDCLFAFRGNTAKGFYRYSIASDSWQSVADALDTVQAGGSLAWDGGDTIYALRGNNGTAFWRYSISDNSWSGLPVTLDTVGGGAALVYVAGALYALRGNNSTTFWKYGSGGWTTLRPALATVNGGGTLVRDGQNPDSIYALRGGGTTALWRYNISDDAWAIPPAAPTSINFGASLYYPGYGKFFYTPQGNSDLFLRFCRDGASSAWSTLTAKPTSVSSGGAFTYAKDGFAYALRGNNTTDFWRYEIETNSWFPKSPIPGATSDGAALAYGTGSDEIYALRGNGTRKFYRYLISGDYWVELADTLSAPPTRGASLCWGGGNSLYALRGNPYTTFWRYDIGSGQWSAETATPSTVGPGSSLVWDGAGLLYALWQQPTGSLSYFYRYSGGTWLPLASAPKPVGEGTALIYRATAEGHLIYALQGGNKTGFMRYSVSQGAWTSLSPAPDTVYSGGGLADPGTGDTLSALRGNATNDLWTYSIGKDLWTPVAPASVNSGGALVDAGDGEYFYALRGNVTREFWRFSISSQTWTPMAWTPAEVFGGGSLTGGYGVFYAFRGAATRDFWKYDAGQNTWASLPAAPDHVDNGGSLAWVQKDGQSYIYALRGNNSTAFWRYDIATATWETLQSVTATVWNGGSLLWDRGDFLYALRGNQNKEFWRYSITGNSWSNLASLPQNVGMGGSLVLVKVGEAAFIHAFAGYGTSTFLRYSIAQDSWSTVAAAPDVVYDGGALVHTGGSFLYAFRGNNQRHFWRYQFKDADATPPFPGTVNDGLIADIDWQPSKTSISASWTAFHDDESRIVRYEWAIGTSPNGQEIQSFTRLSVDSSSAITNGLSLADGAKYYVTVRAVNADGLTGAAWSDGVTVDATPPTGYVSINDGDKYTSKTIVSLKLGAWDTGSGVVEVRFRNDSGNWADDWALYMENMSPSRTLTESSGTRRVFAQFRDAVGNYSTAYDDIVLDLTGPEGGVVNDGPPPGDIAVQNTNSSISANWSGFSDLESGIASYEWAFGTNKGDDTGLSFVSVATSTNASIGGLSLDDGQTYYVAVRATNGAGLSTIVWSDGVTVQLPPPPVSTKAGIVNDGPDEDIDTQTSTDSITANWSGFEVEGGIVKYEWAIGTKAEGEEILRFTPVEPPTATAQNLPLQIGMTYFVTVRAWNADNVSATASSDGVKIIRLVVAPPPT